MRWLLFIMFACVLPASVLAKEDKRRTQIQAASADAVDALRREIAAAPLSTDLTVGKFLAQTDGTDDLTKMLRRAQQIGATRWPDPETCQVELEVTGTEVARTLAGIAAADPKRSPLPPEVIEKRLASWASRTFSAVGTSMDAASVDNVLPADDQPLWLSIPDSDRRSAVSSARRDVAQSVLQSLREIDLGDGKSVADALEVESVRKSLQDWVATRPVVNLEFRPEGEVRMTVATPGEDLWGVFRESLSQQTTVPAPRDDAGWARLRDEVVRRIERVVGRGFVPRREAAAAAPVAQVAIPRDPPAWANGQITAVGEAAAGGPRLLVARSAESKAIGNLRTRIEKYPLTDTLTVGDAARQDPRLAEALDRGLARARTQKVDYGTAGAVTVRIGLDLRDVWYELRERR